MQRAILYYLPDVSDCAAVTDSDLNRVRYLNLQNEGIAALQAGDFQGLVNLAELDLGRNILRELPNGVFDDLANLKRLWLDYNNSLSELPDGVFDGPANLEWLLLNGNDLGELPEGVFDSLSNLERLALYGNKLSALPEGAFEGLSVLERLELQDNPGADFIFTAELEQQGENAVVAKVAQGAPFAIAIVLSAQGGKLSSASVTVEAGSLTSAPVPLAPDASGPPQPKEKPDGFRSSWDVLSRLTRRPAFPLPAELPAALSAASSVTPPISHIRRRKCTR